MNTHESEKLNALLGRKVKIIFFDNCEAVGILCRSEYSKGYKICRAFRGPIHFYKTHIKKITEVSNE